MNKILSSLFLLAAGNLLAADPGAALRQTCAAKAADAAPVVSGSDGWFFLPSELRHIGVGKFWGDAAAAASKSTMPQAADPLPAIVDFKKQLDSLGIELILVPVPSKAFVYSEALGVPGTERLDTFHQEFYGLLRKEGITVIDLLPDLLARKNGEMGPMFCKQDTHWSGMATVLAAEKITALLADKPWLKDVPKIKTATKTNEIEISGDLWGMLPGYKPTKEKIKLLIVGTAESGGSIPLAEDKKSPVVLMGDSHTLVFHSGGDMLASGAGLADQLSHDLGIGIDVIGVRGSGATPARVNLMRRARSDTAYLAGKKVLIWCFTVREFTEASGWSKVPVVK
jgi:alginate O-acetyltransferase complex protein AlgJ